jgi:hypothetical protein
MPPELTTHHVADLDLAPNEASGLLRITDDDVLARHGWDLGFWSVLDEVDAAECVGIIGHPAEEPPAQGWTSRRLDVRRVGDEGRADDAEALARHDGWVYLFGSQHGGKDGPIRRREQWVARFQEADAVDEPVALDVRRTRFTLHRLVNEALVDATVDLLPMGERGRAAYLDGTRAELAGTPDAEVIRPDDWTINVEGAELTPDGELLLGLRYPVTADGRPLLVVLTGLQRLFDGAEPEVAEVLVLDAVGRGGALAGVRDLCLLGETLHVVTGNLDSAGKGSVLLADHPDGRTTVNTHFAVPFPRARRRQHRAGAEVLRGEVVREFPDHPKIEGIAEDGRGRFFYVSDEDETVHLRCTPLLSGDAGET